MQARKLYSHAPITEAVIDLRVQLPEEVKLDTLAQVYLSIQADYPIREDIFVATGLIMTGGSIGATASQTQIGYRFSSSNQQQIFQAQLDGFSFSWLPPYDCWETFRNEAQRLWRIYQSIMNPNTLARIAVRYINRLDLPLPIGDLQDYLRTVPEVSPDLSQRLSGYFMQLQIPQEDITAMLVLNEAIVPPPDSNVVSVLLDIDLFREEEIPNDEAAIWNVIDKLHVRTDEVFEACITDRTRELIN